MAEAIARDLIKSIVERIERLEEEKATLAEDIREVFAEAKGNGFDVKTLRQVIKLRKMDTSERQEAEALLDLYLTALGMTPIERAIKAAEDSDAISGQAAAEMRDASDAVMARRVRKVAADPKVRAALKQMGTPVPLTEEEKAKGVTAAWVQKDGTRTSLALAPKP